MHFGGGVTEEGLAPGYPVKPLCTRKASFKTLFRHVTSKVRGYLLFVLL